MPAKSHRAFILIACACAIFWPGSFIFGLPGVLRQHWQQVYDAGGGAVGGTVFFILRGHLRVDFYRLRFRVRAAWPMAERPYPGCNPGQLHPGFFLPGPDVPGVGRTHPAGSAMAGMSNVTRFHPEVELFLTVTLIWICNENLVVTDF